MIESINVKIVKGIPTSSREDSEESDDEEEKGSKRIKMEEQPDEDEEQLKEDKELNQPTVEQEEQKGHPSPKNWYQKNHPSNHIIADKDAGIGTRRRQSGRNEQVHFSLLSTTEPGTFAEASKDEQWVKAMEEELDQIKKNETWELVPRPHNKNVIGTKWVFRNKIVRWNNSRIVIISP